LKNHDKKGWSLRVREKNRKRVERRSYSFVEGGKETVEFRRGKKDVLGICRSANPRRREEDTPAEKSPREGWNESLG